MGQHSRKLGDGQRRRKARAKKARQGRGLEAEERVKMDEVERAQRVALARRVASSGLATRRGRKTRVPTAADVAGEVNRVLGTRVSVRTVTADLGGRASVVRRARKAAADRRRRAAVAAGREACFRVV